MNGTDPLVPPSHRQQSWPWLVVGASALLGLALIVDQAWRLSATYDEVTYLRVGARWWRTGEQAEITRLGSPLTFWKVQQAPTLWLVDHLGDRTWVDDPIEHQARLLPWIRIGAAWVWLLALGVVAAWARSRHGDRAMAFAALMFALSPNLLAHGALATMELPIVASTAALLLAFDRFLRTGSRPAFGAAAALGGLAFSCKFTAVLVPPILAVAWGVDLWARRDRSSPTFRAAGRTLATVAGGMAGFMAILIGANFLLTGGATLPLSPRSGSHPLLDRHLSPALARSAAIILEGSYPADWVGFATQVTYQRRGGPSYLLGERRSSGWWYYYPVTLLVKIPLGALLILAAEMLRPEPRSGRTGRSTALISLFIGLFLLAAVLGSKRNYGVRYLLPLAPPAIVAASALANRPGGRRWVAGAGLAGMALAVGSSHPYELTFFNRLAGGPIGGRLILADSNLDWGQGAVAMARFQRERPEFRDLTWYYFGDTDPGHYGVVGPRFGFDAHRAPPDLPPRVAAETPYLAVSASLQWGPWGPEGYFRELDAIEPVAYSPDRTVAIYRTADLIRARVRTGPGPG